ncbi:MAG: polysaccharide biosynthesis tyrosine autokinase [Deltaproteobacteria bacterium]|nr:polysaccharide biosynthesis tyrosine autokinase [Deltaproteobacteria bacterium]
MKKEKATANNGVRSYYETFEVRQDATTDEIERAYRKAKSVYSDESVALYSLYSGEERKQKLLELSDIYNTLSDPAKRKSYDESLRKERTAPSREWDSGSINAGRDAFEEYSEVDAFKDRITLRRALSVAEQDQMATEKFRILFNRLEQICLKGSVKSIAVTSAVKGEGKTTTAMNLAFIMATEFKKKVLVIESDFRNPSISSEYLNMGRLHGLIDVLKGDADIRSAINRLEDTNLHFLPARCSVKNSSLLLDSPGMRSVLSRSKEDFDYVIVDSPPIFPLVDVSILSKCVDGMLLVVKAGATPKDIVKKAVRSLPKDNLLGIVLNCADSIHMNKYYY